jgi:flavorubredoxin
MTTRLDPVADGIYRIASFDPSHGITFNQFLIDDERPTLVHTGPHPAYDAVRNAIAQVLDPARLAYVVVPHFEADECGGMGRFVAAAPGATLVCSAAGAILNLSGWDYTGAVQGVQDGDVIDLGRHKLRFLETPHVHHWDSMMAVEETTGSLFPADLFLQPGEQPPLVREDLGKDMCHLYREVGIFPARDPVLSVVDRLEQMPLNQIHPMHGGTLGSEIIPRYYAALRRERFWYEGKVFGRMLPTADGPAKTMAT